MAKKILKKAQTGKVVKSTPAVKATRKPGTYNVMDAKDILGPKSENMFDRVLKAPVRAAMWAGIAKPMEWGVRAAERSTGKTYEGKPLRKTGGVVKSKTKSKSKK